MEACPIILAMLSIGMPELRLIVPKVCRAIWYDNRCLIPQALPTMHRFLLITLRLQCGCVAFFFHRLLFFVSCLRIPAMADDGFSYGV